MITRAQLKLNYACTNLQPRITHTFITNNTQTKRQLFHCNYRSHLKAESAIMQIKYETTTDRPAQCKPSTITKLDSYPLEAFTVQDVPPVTLSRDATRKTIGATPTLVQVILSPFFICHACNKIKTSQATLDENGTPNISLRDTKLKAPFNLPSQEAPSNLASQESVEIENQTDSNKLPDSPQSNTNK